MTSEKITKKEYHSICPKCHSPSVHSDLSTNMIAWGGSTRMICDNCNFSATVFPEVKESKNQKIKTKTVNISETPSKGVVKGKVWGWILTVSGLIIFLLSIKEIPVLSLYAFLQMILGIVLIIKSK